MHKIRIGTRSSKLALIQTDIVIKEILKHHSDISENDIEIVKIQTKGDKFLDQTLAEIGGKSLFTKEIENELINGRINFAVHSLKDFTSKIPDNLSIEAVIKRSDPRDAILSFGDIKTISNLNSSHIIGTSSCRRKAQLLNIDSTLNIIPLRGNVITRIEKTTENKENVAILATAGLLHLAIDKNLYTSIDTSEMLPAPCQGIICVQITKKDKFAQQVCKKINHHPTELIVSAERGFLEAIEGNCNTPIAALAILTHDQKLHLSCEVLSLDGQNKYKLEDICDINDGYKLGSELGAKLRTKLLL